MNLRGFWVNIYEVLAWRYYHTSGFKMVRLCSPQGSVAHAKPRRAQREITVFIKENFQEAIRRNDQQTAA